MALTEEERQALRERLKAARMAKEAKAEAKKKAVAEPVETKAPVEPPKKKETAEDLLRQLDEYEPPEPKPPKLKPQPMPAAPAPAPEPKPEKPKAEKVEKEKKKKYAKLVFYEPPTDKKQLKQLARALGGHAGQSESEEEDEPTQRVWSRPRHEALPPAPAPAPVVDPNAARMKKLSNLSRMFFD